MQRRSLTELASNPDLISGIYNYCDRWCERCPLTSRCLVYATEQMDHNGAQNSSMQSHDLRNQAFWHQLSSVLIETQQLISQWAREAGVDLNYVPAEEPPKRRKHRRQLVDNHPLARGGKKYANTASDWFRSFDHLEPAEQSQQLEDAREVIQWYQYQIAVKLMRALSCRSDGWEDEPEMADFPKDSDGSAKVALIGIERSIAAWRWVQLAQPERLESIVPLILQLERLRQRVENAFPEARDFVRPGFDEILGAPN
jgi:hypothetical protein